LLGLVQIHFIILLVIVRVEMMNKLMYAAH